jgi:hypothetical protein
MNETEKTPGDEDPDNMSGEAQNEGEAKTSGDSPNEGEARAGDGATTP